MLRGDLQTTPLPDLLRQLADAKATGCVYLLPPGNGADSEESTVALRGGLISSVTVPGSEESVATRLIASRHLAPAALAEAREAQETELFNWMLADLLIHLGLAEEHQVHELVVERALADLSDLCEWRSGSWRFRRRQRGGSSLPKALAVSEALETVALRRSEWDQLTAVILGADAVVSLAAQPVEEPLESLPADSVEMDADGFALLCTVDGVRTIAELGAAAGFTVLAAGRTIAQLVDAGLVQVTLETQQDDVDDQPEGEYSGEREPEEKRPFDALAAAFAYDPAEQLLANADASALTPVAAPWQQPRTSKGDALTDALARVSAALSDAMNDPRTPVVAADYEAEPATALETPAEPEAVVEAEVEVVVEAEPVESDAVESEAVESEAVEFEVDEAPEPEAPVLDLVPETVPELAVEETVDESSEFLDHEVEPEAAQDEFPETNAPEASAPEHSTPEHPTSEQPAPEPTFAQLLDEPEFIDVPAMDLGPRELPVEPAAPAELPAELAPVAALEYVPEPEVWREPAAVEPAAPAEPIAPPARVAATHHDMADASRLLSQLAGESRPAPAPVKEPEPVAAEAVAAPPQYAPRPRREDGLADTAALLRELSSLGTENNAPAAPRPTANRPAPAPAGGGGQHARKRKGLFGRS